MRNTLEKEGKIKRGKIRRTSGKTGKRSDTGMKKTGEKSTSNFR